MPRASITLRKQFLIIVVRHKAFSIDNEIRCRHNKALILQTSQNAPECRIVFSHRIGNDAYYTCRMSAISLKCQGKYGN